MLAAEITGLALARTFVPPAPATPASAAVAAAAPTGVAGRAPGAGRTDAVDLARDAIVAAAESGRLAAGLATAWASRAVQKVRAPAAATRTTSPREPGHATTRPSSPRYHGRNHAWIPSLGITTTVQSFPCSRTRPPDAGVYRWGCAGRNNVYLMGHAWSTFKPLHDAYVNGRLHTGMKVIYADASGRVHTFSVAWWRVAGRRPPPPGRGRRSVARG
jgi:hypothetical protein